MQRILMKPFGPIEHVELTIDDIMLFIGPQASGKSTIAKSIYFFKSLKDDCIRYVLDSIDTNNFDKPIGTYCKRIRKKFLDFWGSSYHLKGLLLEFDYGNGARVVVDLKSGYVNPTFNAVFQKKFLEIVDHAVAYARESSRQDPKFLSSSEILAVEAGKRVFLKKLEDQSNGLFNDHRDMIFVPAGRSLLATLADQIQNIQSPKLDYLMNAFIQRINNSKPLFMKTFGELVMDRKKLTQQKIQFDFLTAAEQIIENVLKGRYQFDAGEEKLYFSRDHYTKLNYASSGQQESMWILLLIFLIILENRRAFMVFEEPEAHLFPEAQQDIVQLMALLSNVSDNQVVITTHSPYILSSYNNLLYAHLVGQEKPEHTQLLLDRRLWIAPRRLGAYLVSNGRCESIVDTASHLIKAETIDGASESINRTFDRLFDIETGADDLRQDTASPLHRV
ncbi:MAG: ATP-binding protein [Chloroflexi bacterium]|nr:ATP-binding protein [Chloroflexota bacterium]